MKNKLALIIALFSLFITSCPDVFDISKLEAGFGTVVVNVQGASARTTFPTMAFAKYEYLFSKMINGQTGNPVKQDPVNGYFMLELGDWKVTVKAYAGIDDTEPTATGTSLTFTVTSNSVSQAEVRLAGSTGSGSGSFSYHITYPQNAQISVFTLKNLVNESAPTITISGSAETGDGSVYILSGVRTNVPSGQYFLTIQLNENGGNGRTTGVNEVVYVYNKLDSEYTISFTVEDFSHIHQWGNWAQSTAPTCSSVGIETRRCSHITSHFEDRPGAPIVPDAHNYGNWIADVGSEATETTDGTETKVCSHNNEHFINRCAYATGTQGLAYELISGGANDGKYRIRRGSASGSTVHIPAFHLNTLTDEYLPIMEIGASNDSLSNGAFYSNSTITTVTISEGITTIGYGAFYYCSNLAAVTIPTTVTSIGNYAFYSTAITEITIPDGVTSIGSNTFANCSKLADVTLPAAVMTINSNAFSSCTSLTEIIIPSGVTTIDGQAFSQCKNLGEITVDAGNTNFSNDGGILYNYDKTTLIAYPSASGSVNNISTSVTSIGNYAFYQCTDLTGITIPSGLTSIGNNAFYNTRITVIDIPAGVTSIGSSAFNNCSNLISIDIPASVETIGSQAFSSCTGLASITVNAGNTNFSSVSNILYNYGKTTLIVAAPAGVSGNVNYIPTTVTSITSYAFYECSNITGITIPTTVTSIGERAFYDCTSLASINIPSGVTSISTYMFYYCSSLTSLTIPANVTSIGSMAFNNCTSITSISIPASVTSVGIYAFYGWTSSQTIRVRGYTSQAAADAAWTSSLGDTNWRTNCSAVINYGP